MKTTESRNVYQMVTDRVLEQMEKGIIPWQQPWTGNALAGGGAINYVSRKPYSLLNQLLLGRTGEWITFKQLQERGGRIKKGAKAGLVVYYSQWEVKKQEQAENEDAEAEKKKQRHIPLLRYYNVFHIDDVEGIESKLPKQADVQVDNGLEPIERAEQVINDYVAREDGLTFCNDHESASAYYSPARDVVVVPMLSQYEIVEEYYSTTFHELVHSTSKQGRCNRKEDNGRVAAFGSADYSREELVAELGSAMLCHVLGIDCDKAFRNSVAYIKGWASKLKEDNKAIIWAASRAEKAAKYIMNEE